MMRGAWKGGAGVGTWIQSSNPEACEAAAATGYDFCIIDMEHGCFGWETAVQMVRATQLFGAAAIIRVLNGDRRTIQKTLDLGVDGVLVPKVETAAYAAELVSACRFPTEGVRGACGTTRASAHGTYDFPSVIKRGQALHIWGLIESALAVENIKEILATGLTGIVLGPFDLAFSLGLDGDASHAQVSEAQKKVLREANGADRDCVVSLGSAFPQSLELEVREWWERGARTVTVPSDRALLAAALSRGLSACRSILPSPPNDTE